jgi:hypothetical protein
VALNNNDPNSFLLPFYSIFMALWTTLFLESWKRIESFQAMKWGTFGFEAVETRRPQFHGNLIPSAVTGKLEPHFSKIQRFKRMGYSSIVITLLLVGVLLVVAILFYLRIKMNHSSYFTLYGFKIGNIITNVLYFVCIQILNACYSTVAVNLTDQENHRIY